MSSISGVAMKAITKGVMVGVVGLALAGAAQANLVTNGSFETGDLSGWTQQGDTSFTGVLCGVPSPAGNCQAFFGPTSPGGITQNLATQAGGNYVVTFAFSPQTPPNTFSATFGGTSLGSVTNGNSLAFTNFRVLVTATGANTPLTFTFTNQFDFSRLDAVAVEAPEPASLALLGLGLGALALTRRRKQQ